jgi:hypothetical protein
MITGLIIGLILGAGLLTFLAFWYTKQQIDHQQILDDEMTTETIYRTLLLDLPVEKKLRNALFETERGQAKCAEEISKIIEMQIDLLEGIGKATYVHLKDKPAFFILHNPISGEKRYYYNRDLNDSIESTMLSETQKVLLLYNEHIDLLNSKYNLFKKLSDSHILNLQKIDGIQKQHEQLQKIKKHKGKIAELEERTDIEVNALKNEALLEDIERELEYQNQYLEQFSQLSAKMDGSIDKEIDKKFKTEIDSLISKIEDEADDKD